jgi:hypothetical protein
MPLYTFELREGSAPLSDDAGVDLPDREHALAYAMEVVRELMQGSEIQTRSWRLDVYENHCERIFELPFAALDHTLDHLAPQLRSAVERLCNSHRSWKETVHAACITLRESRALVAQSRGRPYLAAVAGVHTIR